MCSKDVIVVCFYRLLWGNDVLRDRFGVDALAKGYGASNR